MTSMTSQMMMPIQWEKLELWELTAIMMELHPIKDLSLEEVTTLMWSHLETSSRSHPRSLMLHTYSVGTSLAMMINLSTLMEISK